MRSQVRGFVTAEPSCLVFRGIPYATAQRLEPPTAVQWTGVRSCLAFGPACPQPPFSLGRLLEEGLGSAIGEALTPPLPATLSYSYGAFDEDCLNLNVGLPYFFEPRLE